MHYIVFLLFLIMSAGCTTVSPTTQRWILLLDVGSSQVRAVIQPVSNSPEPPNWVLGREHKQYAHAQYLVGVGFSG